MRYVTLIVAAGLILTVTATAGAKTVTLVFDPNDILDLSPGSVGGDFDGGRKADQVNARRVHKDWASTFYETFYKSGLPDGPHTQPDDYNTYMNWRNSLDDSGEGLAMFNTWFLDNAAARSWGEMVVVKPGTTVASTTASGWNMRFIPNPYGLGGGSVQWWTTDPAKRLRPTDLGGADIGKFSITADLYWDTGTGPKGWDVTDPDVELGDEVRFWVGCLNGDDADFYRSDTQAIYFDNQDWGTDSPAYSPFGANDSTEAGVYGSGFEGVLSATAVPEPMTMLAVGMGIAGLAGYIRKRRMA